MISMKTIRNSLVSFSRREGTKSVYSSLVCVLIGIFIGFMIMVFCSFIPSTNADPISGLFYLASGPFSSSLQPLKEFGMTLFYTGPLIFTGLSVAIAYKTGLFNIGAPGQFLMGTMGSLLIALNINTTGNRFAGVFVWLLALFIGVIFGAIWSLIPGLLKAFFGINEVIVSIMSNWIAANIVSWVFSSPSLGHIVNSGAMKSGYLIQTSATGNYTPTLGLGGLFSSNGSSSYLDIGIVLAILMCALLWVLMNKTTLGFELKACGYNKDAARYAGMNEKMNICIAMMIAGSLSAMGGALYYLNPNIELQFKACYQTLPEYGFNGIPAALLANSHPIGVFFSSFFIRYLTSAGGFLQRAGFNKYFADTIIAIIIYFAGFSRFIEGCLFGDKSLKSKFSFLSRLKAKNSLKTESVLMKVETKGILEKKEETSKSKPKKIVRVKKVASTREKSQAKKNSKEEK